MDSHSGMHSSETASVVIHVVINRMAYYISQGRVETPSRRGGQFCCSSVANLLQYLCAKNYQNTMGFDKVIAKIEGCNFLPHSVYTEWYDIRWLARGRQRASPRHCSYLGVGLHSLSTSWFNMQYTSECYQLVTNTIISRSSVSE